MLRKGLCYDDTRAQLPVYNVLEFLHFFISNDLFSNLDCLCTLSFCFMHTQLEPASLLSCAVVGQSLFKCFLSTARSMSSYAVEKALKMISRILLTKQFSLCWFSYSSRLSNNLFSFSSSLLSSSWTHQYTWWIKCWAEQCRGTIQWRRHYEA